MLSRLGFEIIMSSSGEGGLDMIRKFHPDLIILDNIMPNLSGWEITKIVKESEDFEQFRGIPIIMFSAMDDVKDKVEGFELGVEDYITKPFNFSEVLARIRAVLRSHELSRQMISREKNLTQLDALNKSLVYFTGRLKAPALEFLEEAKSLDVTDVNRINDFRKRLIGQIEETIATLSGLENEIEELQSRIDYTSETEISLEEMDRHFRSHFRKLKDNSSS